MRFLAKKQSRSFDMSALSEDDHALIRHFDGLQQLAENFQNVAVVAQDIIRLVPLVQLQFLAMRRALRHNNTYREAFRQGLIAHRDKQRLQEQMIIPR